MGIHFVKLMCLLTSVAKAAPDVLSPEVLERAREVHVGFKGEAGRVAQFGDSITYSMAFWSAMSWSDPGQYLPFDGLPRIPEGKPWKNVIKGARDKGARYANYSGWKVGDLVKSIDGVLARNRPEAAIVMIGTNDINGGKFPTGYRAGLMKVVKQCLRANCLPILNTIPPRRGHDKAVAAVNAIVREIAKKEKLPLADFHAACLKMRPGKTWDGTIISKDGVHPSGGKSNLYDEENLKTCGYALRNWVNFLVYRQLYFGVFEAE